ncbi:acyl-CoA N-acyltransferase [Bimuria novae-zelandiae CBS 107.79]|uniref:Acyl-CoA N-acyltransferase n=1 Tax=Bimuria novae-zelandiae CBS 107.79 TaxID=1447943 RepID=A0A6A5V7Q0_9PLEO|nr:acyl-CoA N-acyltransferase [Bimuria novae-zelandiae CBS 107.79]
MPQTSTNLPCNIRQATEDDLEALTTVELSATSIFGTIPALADLSSNHASPDQLRQWFSTGRIYIAEDNGKPVGYVSAVPMDAVLYIAEISTIPESQGKGIGSALIQTVFAYARECVQATKEQPRVSLTTYREVAWNAPFYRRRGFKEVDAEALGPKHVAKMTLDREERDLWRPGYTRCCMLWEEE